MALDESKKITLTGSSTINGIVAERYTATIDETDPTNMNISHIITNTQVRKDNREQCRKDMAEFEDDAYAQQDELISKDGMVSEDENVE